MSALSICKGLPLSYNSDLQEATHHLWKATETFQAIVPVLRGALSTMSVDEGAMKEAANSGFLWATDLADLLVSEHGLPFRAAHSIVAEVAKNWTGKRDSSQIAQDVEEASKKLGKPLEIDAESISRAMDSRNSIKRRMVCGGPSPVSTGKSIRALRRTIERTLTWVGKKRDRIQSAKLKVGALGEELAG
jgi:argininosuccinate lyase